MNARIEYSIRKNPDAPNWRIAKNLGIRVGAVEEVRAGMSMFPKQVTPAPTNASGMDLSGRRVLPRKPAETAAHFIHKLPLGKGFLVKSLSAAWGIGEDTIRRHAKDLGCLKYVEVEAGEWHPVIMNPETAKQYV